MKKILLAATFVIGMAVSQMAYALTFTVEGSVGGAPTGTERVNFDTFPYGGPNITILFDGDGQLASGSLSGRYAAPYLSGGNGAGFGSQGEGADTTPYLTTGIGAIKLAFDTPQMYMGLLWGSIDNYNTLSFYRNGDENPLISITGSGVLASPNGNQGVNGTLYVNINITSDDPSDYFDYVIASSTQYAFEFDNVAYNETPVGVPDGGSLTGIFALSLIGMAAFARRRR